MAAQSPTSQQDAVDLVLAARPTFDTPGQRALFGRDSVRRLLGVGQRTPDRIWSVDGAPGLLGARLVGGGFALIDLVALPEEDGAAYDLVAAATAWARQHPDREVSFEAPASEAPLTDPEVARVVAVLGRAGWRVHVTRRHYHLPRSALSALSAPAAAPPTSTALPPTVSLERAAPGCRDRLIALLQQVLPGSLDVHDREHLAHGLLQGAARAADDLLDADPADCIRFAVTGSGDVGMISWRLTDDGRGYVLQVGVAQDHRGRGLAGALVAAATRDLLASGATTLVGDTDDANLPMVRAFARAGWHPTASRIDLVLP